MISGFNPLQHATGPQPPALAAANAAANQPDSEGVLRLAQKVVWALAPGEFRAPSPPGVGGSVDLYDTAGSQGKGPWGGARESGGMMSGDFAQGLSTSEPLAPPRDFPYLRPLTGRIVGKNLNTLI